MLNLGRRYVCEFFCVHIRVWLEPVGGGCAGHYYYYRGTYVYDLYFFVMDVSKRIVFQPKKALSTMQPSK